MHLQSPGGLEIGYHQASQALRFLADLKFAFKTPKILAVPKMRGKNMKKSFSGDISLSGSESEIKFLLFGLWLSTTVSPT